MIALLTIPPHPFQHTYIKYTIIFASPAPIVISAPSSTSRFGPQSSLHMIIYYILTYTNSTPRFLLSLSVRLVSCGFWFSLTRWVSRVDYFVVWLVGVGWLVGWSVGRLVGNGSLVSPL